MDYKFVEAMEDEICYFQAGSATEVTAVRVEPPPLHATLDLVFGK